MGTMRVKIHINELDYVQVDEKDPVTVMVEAFPGRSMAGRVDKIGVQADSRTNTFAIEILVDNPNFILKGRSDGARGHSDRRHSRCPHDSAGDCPF